MSKINQRCDEISNAMNFEDFYKVSRPRFPVGVDVYSSQEGEDVLVRRLLKSDYSKKGFYVDIGAHHPTRFSNTYHFYLNGWRGINIDPLPGIMASFNIERPRDINLEVGINDVHGALEYYDFSESAFNTFNVANAARVMQQFQYVSLKQKIMVPVRTLKDVLDEHLPPETEITFLNIDVEGNETNVLRSNDWTKYRPKIVLAEFINDSFEDAITSDLYKFIVDKDYRFIAKTKFTMFFQKRDYNP